MIEEIKDKQSKSQIARSILETLTDWFGITESRYSLLVAGLVPSPPLPTDRTPSQWVKSFFF